MSFEQYKRGYTRSRTMSNAPGISISKHGIVIFNKFIMNSKFKDLRECSLFYNKEKKQIGFKPTQDDSDGYKVPQHPKNHNGQFMIRAFLKYYEIKINKTIRNEPLWDNEQQMYIFDLPGDANA